MEVVVGVAAAAAAALTAWNHLAKRDSASQVIVGIRQQAGVLAALINMVNALLDALLLIKRVVPGGAVQTNNNRFGMRVSEAEAA